jgi:hypothetical protein
VSLGNFIQSESFGVGLYGAGMAANAYFSYQEAKAANQAAEWNASVHEQNARLADVKAAKEIEAAEHDAALQARAGRIAIESQRGGFAASGVTVDRGSALDVAGEQAGRNRHDRDVILYRGRLAAWGHQAEAAGLRDQASFTRNAKRSPWAAAATSLLGSYTGLYQQYGRQAQTDQRMLYG